MAKKKAKKAAKAPKEMVVVGSKVKAYIKANECKTSGELLEALNEKVHCVLDCAIARAKTNKRSTLRAHDL